jgi:hypothetical protein
VIRSNDQAFAAAAHRAGAMNLARMTGVIQVIEVLPPPHNDQGWAVAVEVCWPHNSTPMRFWLQAPKTADDEGEATGDEARAWRTHDRPAAVEQCRHLIDGVLALLREEAPKKVRAEYLPAKNA